jgi:hypothetical protein
MAFVAGHKLYLVGGAPRVGKSSLAQKLVETEGIPWLPTDIVRTVLRRVLPELDLIDQDPVDAARLAEFMYPHIEHAIEVCTEEAEQFLVEGFELSPTYLPRLRAAIGGVEIRACFLGNCTFSAELLAAYRGPKPQHENEMSVEELKEAAVWIRQRSQQLRAECRNVGLPYVDVGELGFESALREARRHLVAPLADQSIAPEDLRAAPATS